MKQTKAMGKFMIMFVWLSIVTIDKSRSAGVKQRLTVAESILNTLQLKADLVAEDIKENSNRISDINRTVLELDKCFVDDNDMSIKTANDDRNAGPDGVRNDGNSRAVLLAFEQEKGYVREMVRSMSATIKDLEDIVNSVEAENKDLTLSTESELKLIRADMTKSLEKVTSNDIALNRTTVAELTAFQTQTVESLKLVEKRQRAENENLKNKIENVSSEQEELKHLMNTVMVSIKDSKKCMSGWTEYKSFSYKYFRLGVKFDVARQTCAYHDAHVVDIQDDEEMNFVVSLVPKGTVFSIGLAFKRPQGEWIWARTGKRASYENWLHGVRPFPLWGRRICVSAAHKEPLKPWGSEGCSHGLSFVCKTKN